MFNGIFYFFFSFPLSFLKGRPHSSQNQLLELAASVSAATDKVRPRCGCMGNGGRGGIFRRKKKKNIRRNNPAPPRRQISASFPPTAAPSCGSVFFSFVCSSQDAERSQEVATLMPHALASISAHCIKNTFVSAAPRVTLLKT